MSKSHDFKCENFSKSKFLTSQTARKTVTNFNTRNTNANNNNRSRRRRRGRGRGRRRNRQRNFTSALNKDNYHNDDFDSFPVIMWITNDSNDSSDEIEDDLQFKRIFKNNAIFKFDDEQEQISRMIQQLNLFTQTIINRIQLQLDEEFRMNQIYYDQLYELIENKLQNH